MPFNCVEGGLFPHLSVADNVGFALGKNISKQERSSIISEMLDLVGLKGFQSRLPQELSGGQQTRVALARALAMKPAMVLLDEPFAALDQALRAGISEEVVSLLKSTKTTTIMVTHDREDALVSADLIALMRSGTVVQSGSPADVYAKPISAEVAESTGDIVTLPAALFGVAQNPGGGDAAELMVRPEEIKISASPEQNAVTATIERINYYGHDALLELKFPGMTKLIRARVAAPLDFAVGQEVYTKLQAPVRWVSGKATRE